MKTRHYILSIAMVMIALMTACEKDKDKTSSFDSSPDAEGNLYITNTLPEPLLLYFNNELIKEIPSEAQGFLVNINGQGQTVELRLWKKAEVDDSNNPDNSIIFRRWHVVLSTETTTENSRATWVIREGQAGTASGTLLFSYPEKNTGGQSNLYSVDVFLNSKTGAKITSLAPGTVNKKVGVDYNYYRIFYNYWYSDPNGTTGRQEIGWLETDDNGQEFSVVVNANNPESNLEVPIYTQSSVGRKGTVSIANHSDKVLQVYANGQLIEDLVISDESTQGLSIINNDGLENTFVLPENTYSLEARTVSGDDLIAEIDLQVIEQYGCKWAIGQSNSNQSVNITNNTNQRISIHNAANNAYLGYWIEANSTATINIDDEIAGLKAIAWNGLSQITLATIIDNWTIDEFTDNALYFSFKVKGFHNTANSDFNIDELYVYYQNTGGKDVCIDTILTKEVADNFKQFEYILPSAQLGSTTRLKFYKEKNSYMFDENFWLDDISLHDPSGKQLFADSFDDSAEISSVNWTTIDEDLSISNSNYSSSPHALDMAAESFSDTYIYSKEITIHQK